MSDGSVLQQILAQVSGLSLKLGTIEADSNKFRDQVSTELMFVDPVEGGALDLEGAAAMELVQRSRASSVDRDSGRHRSPRR